MNEAEKNQALAEASVDTQEILKKYDKESDYRSYSGLMAKVVAAIAITFSCFQLYTAIFGVLDAMIQRSIHLSFGMALVFLLYPTSKKWPKNKLHPLDLALSVLGAITPMYIIVNYGELVKRAGTATTPDMIVGVIGIPLGVSSTFIFLFILFGAYLEKTGLGQYFIDLANSIAGRASGGPAKVAVLSSGLMGTVSGSSVANVVGTGSFTIPMMKRLGYSPEFAGAVEATASTGGQLMPPIMGAAAFLMAEMTNIPYVRIIGAAVIPALLYYFGVWAGVHFEAKKLGLRGMTKEELPNLKEIFFNRGYLMLPLVGIVWLLVTGYTPMLAAFYAIILSVAAAILGWWAPLPIGGMVVLFAVMKPIFHVGEFGADGAVKYLTEMTPLGALAVLATVLAGFALLKKKPRIGAKEIIGGLESGARGAIGVLVATACAGIIIGVVTKTGLGLKLGEVLVDLANGNLILTLVFTMITSIILGMGIPTTANYIITSTIAAPAIIMILRQKYPELPIDAISIILPAHMFAFYFGIIADVTPPVALAAFAGAGIAKANPMKTGLQASKLAIAAFLVPYIFVLNPAMLMIDLKLLPGIQMVLTSMIGIIGVSSGVMGYLVHKALWWERAALILGGILLVDPGAVTDIIGIALMASAVVSQVLRKKAAKASA